MCVNKDLALIYDEISIIEYGHIGVINLGWIGKILQQERARSEISMTRENSYFPLRAGNEQSSRLRLDDHSWVNQRSRLHRSRVWLPGDR